MPKKWHENIHRFNPLVHLARTVLAPRLTDARTVSAGVAYPPALPDCWTYPGGSDSVYRSRPDVSLPGVGNEIKAPESPRAFKLAIG